MKIETNFPVEARENIRNVNSKSARSTVNAPTQPAAADRLERTPLNAPDVRAEMVARGKALIADPNYPSATQIKKIAGVLAANWTQKDASTTSGPE